MLSEPEKNLRAKRSDRGTAIGLRILKFRIDREPHQDEMSLCVHG